MHGALVLKTLLLLFTPTAAFRFQPSVPAAHGPAAIQQLPVVAGHRAPQAQMYDMEMVKKMRAASGAGLSACKKALKEADGDYDKAMEIMRQTGILKAGKRAGKQASQGLIHSYIHQGSKLGVMVEVNCETDFAARTDKFQELAKNIALQIVMKPDIEFVSIDKIPAQAIEKMKKAELESEDLIGKPDQIKEKIVEGRMQKKIKMKSLYDAEYIFDETLTVEEYVKSMIAVLGENIKVARFTKMVLGESQAEEEAPADEAAPAEAAPAPAPAPAEPAPAPEASPTGSLEELRAEKEEKEAARFQLDKEIKALTEKIAELEGQEEDDDDEEAKKKAEEEEEARKWQEAFR